MPSAAPKHRVKSGAPRHSVTVEDRRGTSNERGYGAAWRKIRAAFLVWLAIKQAWPFACCERCLSDRKRIKATDVHHRVARRNGGSDVFDNLEGLCHSCHSKHTAKEVGWTR